MPVSQIGMVRLLIQRDGDVGGGCLNGKMKIAAHTRLAFGPHFAAHHFAKTLADRQAQPRTAEAPGRGAVGLAKGLKKAGKDVLRDTDTGVFDLKVNFILLTSGRIFITVYVAGTGTKHHFTAIGKFHGVV